MPTILLMRPPHVVEAGPCPGVYFSSEAYEEHLKRQNIFRSPSGIIEGQITHLRVHSGESKLGNKLYVGNLPFSATDDELRALFGEYGTVESANVITDRETGRSRGFGFVEFQNEGDAQEAQQALDGREMDGRNLRVNEAQERTPRSGGGRRY